MHLHNETDVRIALPHGKLTSVPIKSLRKSSASGPSGPREKRTMKRSRFTAEQIAYALRQVDGGTAVADVCRQMGIREALLNVHSSDEDSFPGRVSWE